MRFRGTSIRRKIVALLLVPLLSLTALWGFATVITGQEARQLLDMSRVIDDLDTPVEDTVRAIQNERRLTLVYLADPRASNSLLTLRRHRAATDAAVSALRESAQDSDARDVMRPDAAQRLDSLLDAFDGLDSLRSHVEQNSITRADALDFYGGLVDPCYTFLTSLHALEDVDLEKQGRALVGVSRARELLSREDALVTSALITRKITADEIRAVTDLVANRALHYKISLEFLPPSESEGLARYWSDPNAQALREAEERLIAEGPGKNPRAVDAQRWEELSAPVLGDLARLNTEAGERYQQRVQPAAYNVLLKAGIAGVVGFLALLISVVVSVRIGRDLVRSLSRLRKEAHEVSGVRLPSVMRRLAAGESVDVEAEAPRLEYGTEEQGAKGAKDEIRQVGQALNTLQRAAVEAAVKQADVRRGVSEVFVNLARRNQVLLHRQLNLLDAMERRTEDTDELADLFRLDHLTTRMRRHAEGLVILSGAAPSRQWRKPVQLMDVVRAAVSEVEDYERVEVRRLPRIGVAGPAVADVTHLIAELLENATVFSPPHTGVQVHGERVANGFTLEIHDRGLGMTPEALLDANLRLAETPEFELSDTDRLGLFVVSRLAQRQNVRVSLQPSPYGGTTAVVFIPATLLTDAPDTEGTGFRLDRRNDRQPAGAARNDARRRTDGGKVTALSRGTAGRTGPAVLDGPVELEAPVGTLGDDDRSAITGGGTHTGTGAGIGTGSGDIEDTESERGGLFSARGFLRPSTGEQHQQTADQLPQRHRAGGRHPGGPTPLPRRKPPTLVADHGRRVDEPGRIHPPSGWPGDTTPNRTNGPATDRAPRLGPVREQRQPSPSPASLAPQHPPAPAPAPAPAPTPATDQNTVSLGGLPRRVRQASLAPQLRREAEPGGGTGNGGTRTGPSEGAAPDVERDAEEVRDRMASLQRGWQRGRRQNAEDAASGGPAQGTTSEGNGR
ncbi:nitrate- and nitrite sensing domain-containing protein [Streptomyces sp. NPDC127084]|uniref:sensor histidine kinase n=1 Tax=Streptomyces sp. NPDC127084 TaxID=3347133 RepID=UPI0036461FEF